MEFEPFLSQRGNVIIILDSICPAAPLSCASLVPYQANDQAVCNLDAHVLHTSPCNVTCGMCSIRVLIYWFVTRSLNEAIFY